MGTLAFFAALIINNLSESLAIVIVVFVILGAFIHFRRLRDEHELCLRISAAFERHEKSLVAYYNQSRRYDLFGNVDDARWQTHIDRFLQTQVVPDAQSYKSWRASKTGTRVAGIIDRLAARSAENLREKNPFGNVVVSDLTPTEYEHFCADMLRNKGWKAIVTQAARDGGADIIAERGDVRIVVQCKRYTHPVGNKAVQEVNSAVRLNGGTIACVVAPSGFTRQAQMEAEGLGVYLLHHSDLAAFADQISDGKQLRIAI